MKKHKGLKITAIILAAVVTFFAVINIIPPKKNVETNPFVIEKGSRPQIAAHRGASTGTAAGFILTQFLGVNLFNSSDFACRFPPSTTWESPLNLIKRP
ncbi:MAG: hypothetical protein UIG59_04755 [Acutalibacteraceae bacterium]|nr:hypothetical protein [Acutalibacteraceae bacterium]